LLVLASIVFEGVSVISKELRKQPSACTLPFPRTPNLSPVAQI
jgi:hypothetical protein